MSEKPWPRLGGLGLGDLGTPSQHTADNGGNTQSLDYGPISIVKCLSACLLYLICTEREYTVCRSLEGEEMRRGSMTAGLTPLMIDSAVSIKTFRKTCNLARHTVPGMMYYNLASDKHSGQLKQNIPFKAHACYCTLKITFMVTSSVYCLLLCSLSQHAHNLQIVQLL